MRIRQKRRTRILKDKMAYGEVHEVEQPINIMQALKASIREAQRKPAKHENDSSVHREIHVLSGDSMKGGRPATQDEIQRLSGTQEGGVPKGLSRCSVREPGNSVEDYGGLILREGLY